MGHLNRYGKRHAGGLTFDSAILQGTVESEHLASTVMSED
jgi:hypothetical protein